MPEITEEQVQRLIYHLTELDSITRRNSDHCHAAFRVIDEVADIDELSYLMDYVAVAEQEERRAAE